MDWVAQQQKNYEDQVLAEIVGCGVRAYLLDFERIREAADYHIDMVYQMGGEMLPAHEFANLIMAMKPEWVGNG